MLHEQIALALLLMLLQVGRCLAQLEVSSSAAPEWSAARRVNVAQSAYSLRSASSANFPITAYWIEEQPSRGYDRCRTPTFEKGQVTEVKIGVYVESMGNFQATSMDFDVDIYFKEWWQDRRLAHPNISLPGINDERLIDQIWRPDIYFQNSKVAKTNLLTAPNTFMRIAEDGSVFYSVRVNLKLSCGMDFRLYPLDRQVCTMRMISYGHTVDEIVADWEEISVNNLNTLSELRLANVKKCYCDGHYPSGTYSCLEARFYLERQIAFYLIQNYIPTGLIVWVSWISFWIDPASVPGRVSLAVSTLLTLATQSAAIMQKLPPVTYTKAIDIWLGTCMLFVLGALLEYACVNTLRNMKNPRVGEHKEPLVKESVALIGNCCAENGVDGHTKALQLERWCRVLFPATFICFNLFYWPICLYSEALFAEPDDC